MARLIQSMLSKIPTSPKALAITSLSIGLPVAAYIYYKPSAKHQLKSIFRKKTVPISVNYHFSRKCNADCGFCFHTALTSDVASLEDAQHALQLLKNEGMKKLNFAGGEPFLYPKLLGKLCQFAKTELKLESVSIVSNGTRVTEKWLRTSGKYIDILAISCDSFNPETNRKIGRAERGSGKPFDNVKQLFQIRDWCQELGIKFKLNTVVCSLNADEDMVDTVKELNPFRWKIFQVLIVDGENDDDSKLRDARKLKITDEQFKEFCDRHSDVNGFTPEANDVMKASYLVSRGKRKSKYCLNTDCGCRS